MESAHLNSGQQSKPSFLYAYNFNPKRCSKLGDLKIIEMHWNVTSPPSKKIQPKTGNQPNKKELEELIIFKLNCLPNSGNNITPKTLVSEYK